MKSRIADLIARLKFNRPDNLKVVILSIGTAAIFWIFNALNHDYETTVGYPVNWQFNTEKYIVVDELPSKVNINVKGLGWNLLRASFGFKVKPITIVLNNPAASKKIAGVSLTNRIADELEELRLNYVLDDTLKLNIDTRAVRSFAVYVDSASISLKENYRIVSPISCDTDLLELEGPKSMLDSIDSDKYELVIKEKDISSDYDEQVDFEIARADLFLFKPRSAHVAFSVAEFINDEKQVMVEQVGFPEDKSIYIADSVGIVQYTVRKDLEQEVIADSIKIIADFTLINPLDSTLVLTIEKYPPEISGVHLALPQVKVQYQQ